MSTHELLDALIRFPGVMTIDDLAERFQVTRREVEHAIQQARLEGAPVITEGGLRVATTAAEAFAGYRALRRRMQTQLKTAWAMRSAAMLMERGERAARKRDEERAARAAAERAAASIAIERTTEQTSLGLV